MVESALWDIIKVGAVLAGRYLGRGLSDSPKWLENVACERVYKTLESNYPSSRRGKLKQWGEISFIDHVVRWSDSDLSLTVPVDNPEQVDGAGIEVYFRQRQIPVSVQGDFDTDQWTLTVKGNIDDVQMVKVQIGHAVERNRLRPGQTGITQRNIKMDLS